MSKKNSNDTIGNWARDLPGYSATACPTYTRFTAHIATLHSLDSFFFYILSTNRIIVQNMTENFHVAMRHIRVLLSDCMEQSPSWEANSSSAGQDIPHILWNSKVHNRIHKCSPPIHILSHINPVSAPHTALWFMIILPSTPGCSKWFLCLRFPQQNSVCTLFMSAAVDLMCALILVFCSLIQNIPFGISSHRCIFSFNY